MIGSEYFVLCYEMRCGDTRIGDGMLLLPVISISPAHILIPFRDCDGRIASKEPG